MKSPSHAKRLLALDVMRGITIAGMILVNNPGSWSHIYAPLQHAEWNGLTPTDLVFPFFMFIMGVSAYISLRRYNYSISRQAVAKIVRRSVVIYLIGLAIAWLAMFLRGINSEASLWESVMTFDHIRLLGVMPRLAICYGVAALVGLTVDHRRLPALIAAMLAAYAVVLIAGRGWEFSLDNVIARVDHALLGPDHLYADTVGGVKLKFDPEGLLSTLPSIAHALIGFECGQLLLGVSDNRERALRMLLVGTVLTFAGLLLSYGMPINKKIWSPTFVLTTCGLAASLLGLLVWLLDIRGVTRWSLPFRVFGVNPLYLYVQGAVVGLLFNLVKVGGTTVHGWFYKTVLVNATGGDETLASLAYAIAFVVLNWAVGYILYKRQIFIKI